MKHLSWENEATVKSSITTPVTNSDERLHEAFVGPNAAHYILGWDSMQRRRWSWNWSAFLFGEGWLLYRKMYLYAIVFSLTRLTLTPLLSSITPFGDSPLNQAILLLMPYTMILNIALGLYGNHFYRIHADDKIKAAIKEFEPERLLLGVQSKGGVSLLALLWIPVIAIVEHIALFFMGNDFSIHWTEITQQL